MGFDPCAFLFSDDGPEPLQPDSDPRVEEAEQTLIGFFAKHPDETYYEGQLKVLFEDVYFHWVTTRALRQLVAKSKLATDLLSAKPFPIRFYRSPRHRYWRRQAKEIAALIEEFSQPSFTHALGFQGEMMFDAALPKGGFLPLDKDVRSFGGKEWTETGHDLDRCVTRDGIHYGVEIKNTLPYFPREELTVKLQMCAFLGLRPLFIARMHPKSYIEEIRQHGGYGLVFKYQLYPHGSGPFAERVRSRLGLPVDAPRAIADGTIQRFLKWHLASL